MFTYYARVRNLPAGNNKGSRKHICRLSATFSSIFLHINALTAYMRYNIAYILHLNCILVTSGKKTTARQCYLESLGLLGLQRTTLVHSTCSYQSLSMNIPQLALALHHTGGFSATNTIASKLVQHNQILQPMAGIALQPPQSYGYNSTFEPTSAGRSSNVQFRQQKQHVYKNRHYN